MRHTVFITGTDTGVGKTVLTGLALHGLRRRGVRALAIKPFCSGGRADIKLLQSLQRGRMHDDECNPFHFPTPVAPAVAARHSRRHVTQAKVLEHIEAWSRRADVLLVEGAGGLLAPLGPGYDARTLIRELRCPVWITARNALGTLNHVFLTIESLRRAGNGPFSVVLMDPAIRDASASSNSREVAATLPDVCVVRMPFLGSNPLSAQALKANAKKVEKVLAPLISFAIVSPS